MILNEIKILLTNMEDIKKCMGEMIREDDDGCWFLVTEDGLKGTLNIYFESWKDVKKYLENGGFYELTIRKDFEKYKDLIMRLM